jgi:hypothetical protein
MKKVLVLLVIFAFVATFVNTANAAEGKKNRQNNFC